MKFEKGQWYQYENHFWKYDDNCFRHAGDEIPVKNLSYADELIPASLTPDFSNAKVGDECFCAFSNRNVIAEVSENIGYVCIGNDLGHEFYLNGKWGAEDDHPTLFNSFAQFLAYWQEEALKLKEGSDA